jgi:hypothetical protein
VVKGSGVSDSSISDEGGCIGAAREQLQRLLLDLVIGVELNEERRASVDVLLPGVALLLRLMKA